jgi:hypothetical protein
MVLEKMMVLNLLAGSGPGLLVRLPGDGLILPLLVSQGPSIQAKKAVFPME